MTASVGGPHRSSSRVCILSFPAWRQRPRRAVSTFGFPIFLTGSLRLTVRRKNNTVCRSSASLASAVRMMGPPPVAPHASITLLINPPCSDDMAAAAGRWPRRLVGSPTKDRREPLSGQAEWSCCKSPLRRSVGFLCHCFPRYHAQVTGGEGVTGRLPGADSSADRFSGRCRRTSLPVHRHLPGPASTAPPGSGGQRGDHPNDRVHAGTGLDRSMVRSSPLQKGSGIRIVGNRHPHPLRLFHLFGPDGHVLVPSHHVEELLHVHESRPSVLGIRLERIPNFPEPTRDAAGSRGTAGGRRPAVR